MKNEEKNYFDRIVDAIASSIIFTVIFNLLMLLISFGTKSSDGRGLLCNRYYCFYTRNELIRSDIFIGMLIFSFILFFILGFRYGFSGVFKFLFERTKK